MKVEEHLQAIAEKVRELSGYPYDTSKPTTREATEILAWGLALGAILRLKSDWPTMRGKVGDE